MQRTWVSHTDELAVHNVVTNLCPKKRNLDKVHFLQFPLNIYDIYNYIFHYQICPQKKRTSIWPSISQNQSLHLKVLYIWMIRRIFHRTTCVFIYSDFVSPWWAIYFYTRHLRKLSKFLFSNMGAQSSCGVNTQTIYSSSLHFLW